MAFVLLWKHKGNEDELSSFQVVEEKTIGNDISIAIQLYFVRLKCFFVCQTSSSRSTPDFVNSYLSSISILLVGEIEKYSDSLSLA